MLQRLGHDVCSIIDNLIFHEMYINVMQELLHVTSDIYYLVLLDHKNDYTRTFVLCDSCHYYWTWCNKTIDDDEDEFRCRHCSNSIPKGEHINDIYFNPFIFV